MTGGPIEARFPSSTTSNGDSACADIIILDDSDVESTHSFGVILISATPDNVIVSAPQFASVSIEDNDVSMIIQEDDGEILSVIYMCIAGFVLR